jgi:DNA-binding CsgD family transcriptional regulator
MTYPSSQASRALLLENEGLTRERATSMLEAEGFTVCTVGDPALFEELRALLRFDLLVLGIPSVEEVPELLKEPLTDSLLLLAATDDPALLGHLRVLAPGTPVADRGLTRPDTIREALDPTARTAKREFPSDPIRSAFAPFGLSERQLQVLGLALRGGSSREIAAELFVSELTIRNHLHTIYARVGVSGRRELLGRFVQGLLERGE